MELRFTEEQEALREEVRLFAKGEVAAAVQGMEEQEQFPAQLLRAVRARGWMGIPIARELGGAGGDYISYIAAIHEISKVSAALGVILSVHTSVGTLPIVEEGTEAQRQHYVRRLASGQWLGAFALTEAEAGSDAASMRTTAVRDDECYTLNGSKIFITNAGAADLYLTFAVTEKGARSRGITAFLIEKGTPGLRIGPPERKMGLHGSNTCELAYEGMAVPAAQRLGREGQGFAIALAALDGGRIGIAAQALGIAEAALEAALPLAPPSPSRQAQLAELAAQVEAARLLVYRAASLKQAGRPCTKEASMAKMFASDTAVAVTGQVIRLLGASACDNSLPLARYFRDAKVTQIYEGTNEIHRLVISNMMLR
ncbi:acyl-CoA dehydrogenase family protein [Paenibacillus sp. GCM10023252]|uniref:acyl-CoA dehydrogenase family protein n=1 Tax=Paenibacillus sp. GCM10023252 TaxID=3252649 RepID=UPI003614231F